MQVVNAKGQVLGSQSYTPYGSIYKQSGITPAFGYAGMYQHTPSGLNLTWYRAYSPSTARWLSKDPIEEAGGLNLYGYVGGSPVLFGDPLGLFPDSVTMTCSRDPAFCASLGINTGSVTALSINDLINPPSALIGDNAPAIRRKEAKLSVTVVFRD